MITCNPLPPNPEDITTQVAVHANTVNLYNIPKHDRQHPTSQTPWPQDKREREARNLFGDFRYKADWMTHPPWEYCCQGGWQKLHRHTPSASFVESLLDLRDTEKETWGWDCGRWLDRHNKSLCREKVLCFRVLPSIMCFLDSPLSVSALMGQTQTNHKLHGQSLSVFYVFFTLFSH